MNIDSADNIMNGRYFCLIFPSPCSGLNAILCPVTGLFFRYDLLYTRFFLFITEYILIFAIVGQNRITVE
jgi:hypothetical protein